jgi:hypothetical protein
MKMEQTECSETLAFKLQTPVSHPEESIRQAETTLHRSQCEEVIHKVDTSDQFEMCIHFFPIETLLFLK